MNIISALKDRIKTALPPTQTLRQRLQTVVEAEAMHWGDGTADSYHAAADRSMDYHWERTIAPIFARHFFDQKKTIDFAAGFGRNTQKLLHHGAEHVTMVDVNPDCIAQLKKIESTKAIAFQNDGFSLSGLKNEHYTFLYSFDAMVHFDIEIISSYLPEFFRVLEPKSYAFIHHSNYTGNPGGDFTQNPHWRNFMNAEIFKHLSIRSGFEVVEQLVFDWGVADLDCISVLRRR